MTEQEETRLRELLGNARGADFVELAKLQKKDRHRYAEIVKEERVLEKVVEGMTR